MALIFAIVGGIMVGGIASLEVGVGGGVILGLISTVMFGLIFTGLS